MESRTEEQEIASLQLVKRMARMTRYRGIPAELEDATETLNRLIASAQAILAD